MKRILYGFLVIVLFATASCSKEEPIKTTKSILLYVAGNNSLSWNTYDLVKQMDKGYLPDMFSKENTMLAYFHSRGSNPVLCKMNRRADGIMDSTIICVYPESTDSATPEQFSKVLRDAEHFCPAERHGLIFWSHGSGFLPEDYKRESRAREMRSVGCDETTGSEIEIQDFAAALLPVKYDFIVFDCCLMGGIEVAYELKDNTDYLVFSATEIMNQGFPYYMMMEPLFKERSTEEALTKVAKEYYDYYTKRYEETKWSYSPEGCTISVIRTKDLDAVAELCNSFFEEYRDEIRNVDPDKVQKFYQNNMYWFYDFSDFLSKFLSIGDYIDFTLTLNEAVIYKANTPKFQSITIDTFCGMSSYIPNTGFKNLNAYYQCLKWNKATELVKASEE